ncbi:hypothetical protein CFK37_01685 [Virgibacillus phasianinus]|uniref:Peptidase M50 domain-containing protein n=1 Tax=Virgibacillus phasianinus TaxID=2017483 RepID=A0A220TYX7_9BACI|nr:hypothetical protein [Virgibacillus phasianinus]ASK61012.1 hypothetical protein CFK37_01685 [Virgibacillus phasianinus]
MLLFIIFYIVVIPISVLLHEVGHAFGLIFVSKERPVVYLGPMDSSNKENFRIGRVHFHIKWAFSGFCGFKNENMTLTAPRQLLFSAGGPIASLFIAVAAIGSTLFVHSSISNHFVVGIAIWNSWMFLCTIIPIRYPAWWKPYNGRTSDGYRILESIKRMKTSAR